MPEKPIFQKRSTHMGLSSFLSKCTAYKYIPAGPNDEPAVLLFLVFREIHPLAKWTFALAAAFVQIQVTVWIIEPVYILHLFIELSVNFPAGPF